MELLTKHNIYFVGIGGIGMSALARYFKVLGKNVAGYDRTCTKLTEQLTNEKMDIHYNDDINQIPGEFKKNADNTLVVYTPAVPNEHKELNFFRDNGFEIKKRSEVLGLISQAKKTVAIAGTHGKTTISSMLAHLLWHSSLGCNAMLGGILKNYDTNVLINHKTDILVTEADEYDRSFLKLHPEIAVISSIDADHLDIYGSKEELVRTFLVFANQVKASGTLILKNGLQEFINPEGMVSILTYSLNSGGDFFARNIRLVADKYVFDLVSPHGVLPDFELGLPGMINIENAIAALAAAIALGADIADIKRALATFSGVKRRFDYQVKSKDVIYIDDYAHHPEELKAVISSVRAIYPGKKITGIFQPHLFSRTRDFADEFARSLELLDELVLLDIYPARETPLKGVDSGLIFHKVNLKEKYLSSFENLIEYMNKKEVEVLLTLGAGDIDKLVGPLKKLLTERNDVVSV